MRERSGDGVREGGRTESGKKKARRERQVKVRRRGRPGEGRKRGIIRALKSLYENTQKMLALKRLESDHVFVLTPNSVKNITKKHIINLILVSLSANVPFSFYTSHPVFVGVYRPDFTFESGCLLTLMLPRMCRHFLQKVKSEIHRNKQ